MFEWLIIFGIGFVAYAYLSNNNTNKKVSYTSAEGTKVSENLQRRSKRQILNIEKPNIDLTPELLGILEKFEDPKLNIFLTGKAGTGKSTLLKYFRSTTNKNHAVVAPTGIAAINVQGQTIHSFFNFGINITPSSVRHVPLDKLLLLRKLDVLIIDEISMVRADLLDSIDISLRKNRRNNLPFGGVKMIVIGDPYQLPPVVKSEQKKYFETVYQSPHFFSAKSYEAGNFSKIELTRVHRQSDPVFINILNSIRDGTVTQIQIDELNNLTQTNIVGIDAIKLVSTNALAKAINESELNKIESHGKVYKGHISGDFKENIIPAEIDLLLKEGAKIMLLNNERNGRWVNGDIGIIIGLNENSVRVKFDDNTYDDVEINEWDNIRFIFDEVENKILPEVIGKYIQLPIKLAWAVTIHKSQGQSHKNVHIDFGKGTFAPGQAYVAISRCTSLQGLSFESPLILQDIIVDPIVNKFMGVEVKDKAINELELNKVNSYEKVIPKSDLNKLKSFINNPYGYAINTSHCINKVKYVKEVFAQFENIMDKETKDSYKEALSIYNHKMGKIKQ